MGKTIWKGFLREGRRLRGVAVAEDCCYLFKATAPVAAAGIAEDQRVRWQTGRNQHRSSTVEELGPVRDDRDQVAIRRGKPGAQPTGCGANGKHDQFKAFGKRIAHRLLLCGPAERDCCQQALRVAALFRGGFADRPGGTGAKLRQQDLPQLGVGIDQHEVVGWR